MESLKAILGKRVAGIPVWVWAVGASAVVIGYVWWTNRDTELAPAPAADPAADAGDIEGIPGGGSGGSGTTPDVDLETNAAWSRYVKDRLTALGEDPILVSNAIDKVLSGKPITERERAVWDKAVRIGGSPPEGNPIIVVIPDTTTPTPKPPTPTTPTPGVYVTVKKYTSSNPPWESTLWGMAQHYYKNGDRWPTIWNHPKNKALADRARKMGRAHYIQTGDRVWVPL